MRIARIATAVVLGTLGISACDTKTCTLAGCDFPLRIVVGNAEEWMGAESRVHIEFDGSEHTLTCNAEGACEADAGSSVVEIMREGARLEFGLDLGEGAEPETLTLEVVIDGDTALSESITPEYEETFPNGEDCSSCMNASVSATVPERSQDANSGD